MAKAVIGKGDTILFWQDDCGKGKFKELAPELYSFSINQNLTIRQFLQIADHSDLFHTPLSNEAFQQLQGMQVSNQSIQLSSSNDKWRYPWATYSHP